MPEQPYSQKYTTMADLITMVLSTICQQGILINFYYKILGQRITNRKSYLTSIIQNEDTNNAIKPT